MARSERPSIVISPAVAGSRPEITRRSVVLPAPLAPMTATASPGSTRIETPNSAWKPP
jgi:hypothetical protein